MTHRELKLALNADGNAARIPPEEPGYGGIPQLTYNIYRTALGLPIRDAALMSPDEYAELNPLCVQSAKR